MTVLFTLGLTIQYEQRAPHKRNHWL